MRDITLEDTIYMRFTTRAFATGIPGTLGGSPVVSAYENDSATQITAGITLGVDHDSVTGLNLLTIVATAANGYEASKDYDLVITTGTVDSVSVVGEVVGQFTIGRSAAAVDLANGTDGLGAIKAETATIVADTNELQTDWADGGRLDLIQDIIAADTTTDIPALIATAQADLDLCTGADGVTLATSQANYAPSTHTAAAVFTTQMTEAYAADGVAPTPAQALMLALQRLTEFSITTDTITINKLDGSTPAATLTMDDATDPTSSTRAT